MAKGTLTIYQAVLKTYAEMHGVSLDDALEEAVRQSSGKDDAEGQIEQYTKAYKELSMMDKSETEGT
jgi:hypothetical protein